MEAMTIKQIEKYVNQQMREVFVDDVAPVIKEHEQESINKNVYNAYTPGTSDKEPWMYKRRRENGGLSDKRNMKHSVKNLGAGLGVELSVENVTKGKNDRYKIADLVEYGQGTNGKYYEYDENRDDTAYQYLQARPFTAETVKSLQSSGDHIDAFKKGMQSRGITVE